MKTSKEYLRTVCECFVLDSVVMDVLKSGNQNEDLKIIELLKSNLNVAAGLLSLGGFSEKEVQSECDKIIAQFTDDEWEKKTYDHYEKIYNKFQNKSYL